MTDNVHLVFIFPLKKKIGLDAQLKLISAQAVREKKHEKNEVESNDELH